jgi:hypothetical protein
MAKGLSVGARRSRPSPSRRCVNWPEMHLKRADACGVVGLSPFVSCPCPGGGVTHRQPGSALLSASFDHDGRLPSGDDGRMVGEFVGCAQ